MALETGTYISDLVTTNPPGSDPKSQMDDHLRLIKSTIKTTFPNITGAMTMTHTELNTVTSRGLIAGQTWTGTHTFPATTYGVTAAFGASGTAYATLDFVNAVATNAALPAQTGNAGKYLVTNGTTSSWTDTFTIPITHTSRLILAKAADIASAATPDIWSGAGNTRHVTGTTTLTGFAAAPQAGMWMTLYFDGACLLTNGANFNVLGGANYTTAAGDMVDVYADTTTKFYLYPRKASGKPMVVPTMNLVLLTSTQSWVVPDGVTSIEVTLVDGGYSGQGTTATGNGSGIGGRGGHGGTSVITVASGVSCTATIGAGGAGSASGGPAAGGATTFAGSGFTTMTSSNATYKMPGGICPFYYDGTGQGGAGGGSIMSPTAGTGYGGGGAGGYNGASVSGTAGAIIIRYMS